MKSVLFVFLFGLLPCLTFAQFKMNDTTFLLRKVSDSIYNGYNFYHAIYFERNKNAKEYDWIRNFGFDKYYGKNEFRRDVNETKKYLQTELKKIPLKGIVTKWCELKLYKDSFYMYSPSEYCENSQFEITSSLVIEKGCERTFSILDTIIKLSETHYQIKAKAISYQLHPKKYTRTINIYFINKKEGIAVIEGIFWDGKGFMLMVNAANIKHFPLIVNHCITDKTDEFEFDKIDFDSLLKKFRTHKSATQQKLN